MEAGPAPAAEAAQPPPAAPEGPAMDVCVLEDEARAEDFIEPEELEDFGTVTEGASVEAPADGLPPA
eukprot:6546209-Lingulodinium_polyedra.AAC.1